MSRRLFLLVLGFLLIMLVNAGLLGVLIYGPGLDAAPRERLGPFAPSRASQLDSGVVDTGLSATGGAGSLDSAEQRNGHLVLELQTLREHLAELTMSNALATDKAAREIDVLRLKLENAERSADDAERKLAESRNRIAALESDLGLFGDVEAIIDAVGQPAAEPPTLEQLARLGGELRLVEQERDGARAQLDRALERITELAQMSGLANESGADGSNRNDSTVAEEMEVLKNANSDLNAALKAHQAQAAIEQAVNDSVRRDLESELAAVTAAKLDYEEKIEQLTTDFATERDMLTAAVTAAKSRIAALEADAQRLTNDVDAQHEAHQAVIDDLQARISELVAGQMQLVNERDTLATLLAAAEARNAESQAEIARLAAAQDAESVARTTPSGD